MSSHVTYRKSDHVAIIEIVDLLGGWCTEVSSEFADLCEQIAWDEEVRAVVLVYDGAGHSVVTGDCGQCAPADPPTLVGTTAGLRQPVIAAIKGNGLGPGLELALACDIRIGTEGACFGLPALSEGLIPSEGGTQRLPRLVGQGKAMEMILFGELIDATEALRIGLVNRVVPSGELAAAATMLAEDIARKSPLAVSYVKEALHKGMDLTLEQGMRMELDLYLLLFTTSDREEGITAFREKRAPRFEGR
jgi:enoyl-CoA hydratase/carnithine racemase